MADAYEQMADQLEKIANRYNQAGIMPKGGQPLKQPGLDARAAKPVRPATSRKRGGPKISN
jgi:hypothetical protein